MKSAVMRTLSVVLSLLAITGILSRDGAAHDSAVGTNSAGMLDLTAVADIYSPDEGGTVEAGWAGVSGSNAQWVRVASAFGGGGTSVQVDFEMTVSLNGSWPGRDAATQLSVTLDPNGSWTKYSQALDSDTLAAGSHTGEANSSVQISGDDTTRASAGPHTHQFTAI